MRRIYSYQVVRYFPHLLSDEFINIGVVLTTKSSLSRILTEEEAKYLHCSAFIGEKKKFLGIVEYLNNFSLENRLLESNHYFHNFRFSEERKVASTKTEEEIINELFEDYIGFKIQSQNKLDTKEIIMEKSIKLVQSSDFKRYVRINRSNEFDFEIESIRRKILHHSNIGKSNWKQDVTRMVMSTPISKEQQYKYDFLDMSGNIDTSSHYIKKLEQNLVDIYPYESEDQIANYLKNIA